MGQLEKIIDENWKVTVEGMPITFAEFLNEFANDGISKQDFADEIEATLEAAADPDTQWESVIDYIAPIAKEILSESVQVDREIYVELVNSIKYAYTKLRSKTAEERAADTVFELDRGNVDFLDDLDNLIQTLAGGDCAIKTVNSAVKGQYSITVSKTE
ncbi:hypothetical protein H1230_18800 [Paenibacillus sp. 19GGS1-52]|uniref:hypothetical protein n=1 Tax=Paenibacillus sp. 19GGS1-52 TaxID=2758563 RepID=UPI001EFAC025|nr:hypothetical protein [Paenibacillus sp. 19GGS1-52]ULO05159.1 hypothetical protein H1230_18800 [Paenibacillus sp. 19GGS1-52]